MPLTKAAIAEMGQSLVSGAIEVEICPIESVVRLRAMRDVMDTAIAGLMADAIDEIGTIPEDSRVHYGVKLQLRNGRTTYNYKQDSQWTNLKAEETAVSKQRKAREQFLQMLDEEVVDPQTGEFIQPARVARQGKPTLALVFPEE